MGVNVRPKVENMPGPTDRNMFQIGQGGAPCNPTNAKNILGLKGLWAQFGAQVPCKIPDLPDSAGPDVIPLMRLAWRDTYLGNRHR